MSGDEPLDLDSGWRVPEGAGPAVCAVFDDLQHVLCEVAKALPDVASAPRQYTAEQIYVEARRVIFGKRSKSLSGERRAAVLNALNECLVRVDRWFKPRVAIYHPPPPNPFPAYPSDAVDVVKRVRRAFHRLALGQQGLGTVPALEPTAQVGMLLASVVLRQAQCSRRVLTALAMGADRALNVAGQWFYVDVASGMGNRMVPERRRVFMDVVTACVYVRVDPTCAKLFERPVSEKLGVQQQKREAVLRKCFAAFLGVAMPRERHPPTLDAFIDARAGVLRMSACSVLCDYATGTLVCSSFREPAFLRLFGYQAAEDGGGRRGVVRIDSGMSSLSGDQDEGQLEQTYRGVFDMGGLLARLRAILRSPRVGWEPALRELLQQVSSAFAAESGQVLLARWAIQLATRPRPGGKKAADGTVRNMLGTLGGRLLDAWPDGGFGGDATADDLAEVYAGILETAVSHGHQPRLAAILSDFDRFYRNEVHPKLKSERPELTIDGGYYEISTDALGPDEYVRLRHEIYADASPFNTRRQRDQALIFVVMAWRFGMRRSEILGLQRKDFQWLDGTSRSGGHIFIRDNGLRRLKTRNSRRIVPVALLGPRELAQVRRLFDTAPDQRLEAAYFQEVGADGTAGRLRDSVIMDGVNALLRRVTAGAHVHPHNLRHAFASFAFLALVAPDVRLQQVVPKSTLIDAVLENRERLERALLNEFRASGSRAYAVSRMLGHGSLEMTFLCYVHTLDLLLFAATARESGRGGSRLGRAVQGIPLSQRHATHIDSRPLGRVLRRLPDRVLLHAVRRSEERALQPTAGRSIRLAILTTLHGQLAALPEGERTANGGAAAPFLRLAVPVTPSQRLAALAAIAVVNAALVRDEASTLVALRLWSARKRQHEDWASLDAAELATFAKPFCAGKDGVDTVEVMEVRGVPGTKRKTQNRLTDDHVTRLLKAPVATGRYLARLRDGRKATTRRKLDATHRSRQSTQKSVSWVVLGASAFLGGTSEGQKPGGHLS